MEEYLAARSKCRSLDESLTFDDNMSFRPRREDGVKDLKCSLGTSFVVNVVVVV